VCSSDLKGAANPLMNTAVNTTLSGAGSSMMTNPLITNAANSMTQAGLGAGSGVGFIDKATQNVMDAGSGLKNIATGADRAGAYNAFKAAGGTPMQLALPVGGALLGGLEPSDLYGEPIDMDEAKRKQRYDPNATLNLSGDTGLRLYATGGTIQSGGIRDLYGTPDNQPTISPGLSGFGLGRLNNLAGEQALNQAQTLGYAMGGPVSFADGGDSNKEDALGLPSLSPDMSMDPNAGAGNLAMIQSAMKPTQGMQGNAPMSQGQMPDQSNDSLIAKVTANLRADPNYQPTNPIEASIVKQIRGTDPMQQGQPSLQGLGSLGPAQPSQPMAPSYNPSQSMAPSFNPSVAMGPTYFAGINAPQGYADGGDVVAGERGMNLDALPTLNVNTGTSSVIGSGNSFGGGSGMTGVDSPLYRYLGLSVPSTHTAQGVHRGLGLSGGNSLYTSAGVHRGLIDGMGSGVVSGRSVPSEPIAYALNLNSGQQEAQYARGGYLNGDGDGMDDRIPATIEGKQPARLSNSEFVIPADVVSHLGNGSSEAGSKRLYSMLDRVRKARTGNKKQGKEIKAEKYLPA
jgi:hypothetical protein